MQPAPREPVEPVVSDAWEVFAGFGPRGVRIAAHDSTVWFVADRVTNEAHGNLWLTATTDTGVSVVDPIPVDTDGGGRYLGYPTLAVTDANVHVAFVKYGSPGDQVFVRSFDPAGVPLTSGDRRVPISVDNVMIPSVHGLALAASPDGGARLLTASDAMTQEVAIAELDPRGLPTGRTSVAGTNDDGQNSALAIATQRNGATVIAWDRAYDNCFGPYRPQALDTTTIDAAALVGPLVSVNDLPNRDVHAPVLASIDDATFIAWQTGWDGSITMLAQYPDLSASLELHDAFSPALALTAADRGAVMWTSADGIMRVSQFAQLAGHITLADERTFGAVANPPSTIGLVSVGAERFVLAWRELDPLEPASYHVFARTIDFTQPDQGDAPRTSPRTSSSRRARPCSH
ncbi:MAG: hypothetical protein H0T79_21300 [Deltaproteobacteria bacterium]|nr:hypothetical protein [Deltaproteobacteria bacterium]